MYEIVYIALSFTFGLYALFNHRKVLDYIEKFELEVLKSGFGPVQRKASGIIIVVVSTFVLFLGAKALYELTIK